MKNKDLIHKELEKLKQRAYCPYSKFRVSAIVFLKNGEKIKGINIENAAFGSTLCAERTALSQVYSLGYRKDDIEWLALSTDSDGFGSPCGACRQYMAELMNPDCEVMIFNKHKYLKSLTVEELLPHLFTNEELK